MDGDNPFRDLFAKAGVEGTGKPLDEPEPEAATPQAEIRVVVIGFEKRAGNKSVTTLRDVPAERRADLLADLKKALGTGGSVVGDLLVIQGDRRVALTKLLEARGVQVRGERGGA